MSNGGWIGVDFDGTLAEYDGWKGALHLGEPIRPMVERIQQWVAQGRKVKIFTARVYAPRIDDDTPLDEIIEIHHRQLEAATARQAIQQWCIRHIGMVLPVTNVKDFAMTELWDDRAVRVVKNVGQPCSCCGKSVQAAQAAA